MISWGSTYISGIMDQRLVDKIRDADKVSSERRRVRDCSHVTRVITVARFSHAPQEIPERVAKKVEKPQNDRCFDLLIGPAFRYLKHKCISRFYLIAVLFIGRFILI